MSYFYLKGNRETIADILLTIFCTSERGEGFLTPMMGILGFFVVLATAECFTGDGLTRFFLTRVTKSPSEVFSPATVDKHVENSYPEPWHQGYQPLYTQNPYMII
jgi:hypothetical protein